MDLTKTAPRSPYEMLEGIVFLPRAIDKMRAHLAGTKGEYNSHAGTSERLLRFLFGMTPAEFEAIVSRASVSFKPRPRASSDAAAACPVRQRHGPPLRSQSGTLARRRCQPRELAVVRATGHRRGFVLRRRLPSLSLRLLGDLDQVATGVIEDGGGDGAHLGWGL